MKRIDYTGSGLSGSQSEQEDYYYWRNILKSSAFGGFLAELFFWNIEQHQTSLERIHDHFPIGKGRL